MKLLLQNTENYQTTKWSGGNTTQLFIYPENASYAQGNFALRISTAIIVSFESDFTVLPDTKRKLVLLKGALLINHPGRYSSLLLPLDIETFEGDWNTRSKGTGQDFNVMCKGNIESTVYTIELEPDLPFITNFNNNSSALFLYLFEGELAFNLNNNRIELKAGMSLWIEDYDHATQLNIVASEFSKLIVTEISTS